mgnify:CR=1 FL=1
MAVDVVKDLGSLIREARHGKRLTQQALADLLGKGQPAVCGWEKNKARPSTRTLALLAGVLDLDLGDVTLAAGAPLEVERARNGSS